MEKELKIKVKLNNIFEISCDINSDDWDQADNKSKEDYVKEKIKEYLLDNIDDIVNDLKNEQILTN